MGVAASASLSSTKVKPAFVRSDRLPWEEDLEGQLLNPGGALKQLLKSWRKLPPNARPQVRATSPRIPQRAEERLGPNGVAQLCADYGAGRSTKYLQRTYGLSQGAVLRLLDANGMPRRQRGLTDEQVQEAIKLYGQG
jgi:hypothetical protein